MLIEPLPCPAALSHHWLVRRRGGEKVLDAIATLVPDAPVYTLVHDPAGFPADVDRSPTVETMEDRPPTGLFTDEALFAKKTGRRPVPHPESSIVLGGRRHRVITSWLQALPGVTRYYPQLLPLLPAAARAMHIGAARLVICSDAAIAKSMTVDESSRLVCYCHSPMRYVWEEAISEQYAATLPGVLRPMWPAVCAFVRRADARAARRVDRFVANSRTVAERIRRCYGREADVVYPPVDVPEEPPPPGPREDYYLAVGHHVAYKRLDLAVEACVRLGRRLVVIGGGREAARLRDTRPAGVEFLGFQPDAEVVRRYRAARGLLFPGEEDFGIVPVEAMAHGCPVIAYGRGGATETVADGVTGALFAEQAVESVVEAIGRAESTMFDPRVLHAHALRFNMERFLSEIRFILADAASKGP